MENVVVKGTASTIYSPNFSMAGKTGTAKKFIGKYVNEKGDTIPAGYSNKRYVASFAGFFPADVPKYSCIVVIHDPLKKKGYYGATVAAPVFKEIAQKIYTTTSVDDDLVKEKFSSQKIGDQYSSFYNKIKNTEKLEEKALKRSISLTFDETIDCNEAKYECLELIRENKDEIKEINYFSVIEDTFFSVANNASISIGIMYQSSCLDHF